MQCSEGWWNYASVAHRWRVLQVMRVLTRDPAIQAIACEAGGVAPLCAELVACTNEWFAGATSGPMLQALVEITSCVAV